MRLIPVISLALSLIVPHSSLAQSWVPYASQEDLFTVLLPGEPAVRDITWMSEYFIDLPGRVYVHEDGPRRYSVTVIDYRGLQEKHAVRVEQCRAEGGDGDLCVNRWQTDQQGATVYATWPLFQRDAEVTHFSFSLVDRVAGNSLQLTNPDRSRTYVSINMHEDRLYILEGTVPGNSAPPMLFKTSLGFLDEEGESVSYQSVYRNGFPAPVQGEFLR